MKRFGLRFWQNSKAGAGLRRYRSNSYHDCLTPPPWVVSQFHRDHTAKPQQGRKSAKRVVEIPFRVLADCCLPAAPAAAAQAGAFAVSTAYEDSASP